MSVERKPGGGLRLACDGEWCPRKFSPKATAVTRANDLRWRATLYGWHAEPEPKMQPSIPGVDSGAPSKVRDLCPECRRRPA